MTRERPLLGTPYGVDGPWLAAMVDVLGDLYDLLDQRLPQAEGAARVAEPAPSGRPARAKPVAEPAPDGPPDRAVPVAEPAPDEEDDEADKPAAPPRAGRGSALAAWQAFARAHQVAFAENDGRDDIIAACVAAGVIPAE